MTPGDVFQAHLDEYANLETVAAAMERVVGRPLARREEPPQDGSLRSDLNLQSGVSELRRNYLIAVSSVVAQHWRTPETGKPVIFPGDGLAYEYAYDRQHPPLALENRIVAQNSGSAVLCSSGMAALNVVFSGLAFLLGPNAHLAVLASYFETLTLLRISPFARRWSRFASVNGFAERIAEPDVAVVLVEPVRYDWGLTTEDWAPVIEAIKDRREPPILVIDTTLCHGCVAQRDLVDTLKTVAPVVLEVRSGIKLDQIGFELANVGIIEWNDHSQESRTPRLKEILSACRVAIGATLTWTDSCALSPQFIFDTRAVSTYSRAVFATNRALYKAIQPDRRLFEEVVYPGDPWVSPFVLFKLRVGGDAAYRRLAYLISQEQAHRGLQWRMSGSFGFRSARYETILPNEQTRAQEAPEGVLKVAAGCYEGAQFQAIVELLNELADFPDLETVNRVWGRRIHAIAAEV
jgi:hypothetical protein